MNNKAVALNVGLINYDGNVDYPKIASRVVIYDEASKDKVLKRVNGFTIIVTKEIKVADDIVRKFPDSVKMIYETGTGYDSIDLDAVHEKGIILCNIPAYSSERVAHIAVLMILNLASSMQKQIRMSSEGNRDNFHKHLMMNHVEVDGRTPRVVDYGNIAKEIIKVAQALGMKILVTTRTPRVDVESTHFTINREVFMQNDSISLNCPLDKPTRHMISRKTLAMMKSTVYLVNTARGALADEKALIDASQNNVITGTGLNVREVESLDGASPLYTMNNVVITPHMGWRGLETRQRLVSLIQDSIRAFSKGQPINRIN